LVVSNVAAAAVVANTTAAVFSFAEESCFDKQERFKSERGTVVFRLYSVGKRLGRKIDLEFNLDYGVYYDGDDSYLLEALETVQPLVAWKRMIFWRHPGQARITIIDPDDDKASAYLETRKYEGKAVSEAKVESGEYGPNVVSLRSLRAAREMAEVRD
jgi:hypothetical protein